MYNQVENIEPGVGSSEIVLDTDKTPWLLDHQFQSITIAPGALLVASILESEQSAADIKFENMIPVSESLPGRVAIVQDQSNIAFRSIDGKTQYASLTLGGGPAPTSENGDFVSGEARELYGSQLYNKLKGQGNDYGPAFQVITNIKSADDGWEATWQVVEEASSLERMTVLLDSLTHVVAGLGGISSS